MDKIDICSELGGGGALDTKSVIIAMFFFPRRSFFLFNTQLGPCGVTLHRSERSCLDRVFRSRLTAL